LALEAGRRINVSQVGDYLCKIATERWSFNYHISPSPISQSLGRKLMLTYILSLRIPSMHLPWNLSWTYVLRLRISAVHLPCLMLTVALKEHVAEGAQEPETEGDAKADAGADCDFGGGRRC
jgi:hypothetical protein